MVSTRTDEDITRDLIDALSKMNVEQKNVFDRIVAKAMPGVRLAYPDGRIVGEAESKVLFWTLLEKQVRLLPCRHYKIYCR